MFIANLTYIKPLEDVEQYLTEHIQFLDKHYSSGHFIASGRKNPRTGGIILIKADNLSTVHDIIKQDPFYQHQIADYEIIDFEASKYSPEFKHVL